MHPNADLKANSNVSLLTLWILRYAVSTLCLVTAARLVSSHNMCVAREAAEAALQDASAAAQQVQQAAEVALSAANERLRQLKTEAELAQREILRLQESLDVAQEKAGVAQVPSNKNQNCHAIQCRAKCEESGSDK